MKSPRYICSKCRQPFTRRWNANRHCNNKHFCALENVISNREHNKTTRSILLNHFCKYNKSNSINFKNQLFLDNLISVNNSRISTLTDLLDNAIEHELLSYERLDQLAPNMKKYNVFLIFYMNHLEILLGIALSSAINSNNL